MTNYKIKNRLMLQSLSPLALLTIIRNFRFEIPEGFNACSVESWLKLFLNNRILVGVMILCLMWLVAAIFSFVSFSAFIWSGKEQGYEIENVEEKEDASLNFFMTMISAVWTRLCLHVASDQRINEAGAGAENSAWRPTGPQVEMDNIFIRTDPAGNIKADETKSTEKIDGAIAMIMALDRAIGCGNEKEESVYNSRGLLEL